MPSDTSSKLVDLYDKVRHALKYERNPVIWIVVVGGLAAITGWKIFQGMDPQEILTEYYIEYLIVLGTAIIARLKVWSPETVADMIAGQELERQRLEREQPVVDSDDGDVPPVEDEPDPGEDQVEFPFEGRDNH